MMDMFEKQPVVVSLGIEIPFFVPKFEEKLSTLFPRPKSLFGQVLRNVNLICRRREFLPLFQKFYRILHVPTFTEIFSAKTSPD